MPIILRDTRPDPQDAPARTLMKILDVLRGGSASATATGGIAITSLSGSVSIANNQVALNNSTPTQIVADRVGRRLVHIKNTDGSIVIYVGGASVSASNGFPLAANEFVILETEAAVYGISASGTPSAAYIEQYDA